VVPEDRVGCIDERLIFGRYGRRGRGRRSRGGGRRRSRAGARRGRGGAGRRRWVGEILVDEHVTGAIGVFGHQVGSHRIEHYVPTVGRDRWLLRATVALRSIGVDRDPNGFRGLSIVDVYVADTVVAALH